MDSKQSRRRQRSVRMTRGGPDQCWSWVIAMSVFIINLVVWGLNRASGVLFVAVIDEYGVSRFDASLPFTVTSCVGELSGPFVGIMGHRFGIQKGILVGGVLASLGPILCYFAPNVFWMIIFWGGLHGLGTAFSRILCHVIINQYFEKYRATGAGVAMSGASIGAFLLPPIIELALMEYGLAGAYLIAGGLAMHILPPAIFLKEPHFQTKRRETETIFRSDDFSTKEDRSEIQDIPMSLTNPLKNDWNTAARDETTKEDASEKFNVASTNELSDSHLQNRPLPKEEEITANPSLWESLVNVYMNPMFHLISVNFGIVLITIQSVNVVIMDYSNDKGLGARTGKYFILALAIGSLIGRLGLGWVTDKGFMTLYKFMFMIQLTQGICIALFPMFLNFEVLMFLAVTYGVCYANAFSMRSVLVGRYVPNEQTLAFGCIALFSGITTFTTPFLIGHFRDHLKSYDGLFYTIGGLSFISGIMWFLEPRFSEVDFKKQITQA